VQSVQCASPFHGIIAVLCRAGTRGTHASCCDIIQPKSHVWKRLCSREYLEPGVGVLFVTRLPHRHEKFLLSNFISSFFCSVYFSFPLAVFLASSALCLCLCLSPLRLFFFLHISFTGTYVLTHPFLSRRAPTQHACPQHFRVRTDYQPPWGRG
jgi:hypothetical protein